MFVDRFGVRPWVMITVAVLASFRERCIAEGGTPVETIGTRGSGITCLPQGHETLLAPLLVPTVPTAGR